MNPDRSLDNELMRKLVRQGLMAPMMLAFALAAVLLGGVENLGRTAAWVEHTDRVIARAARIEKTVLDAEGSLRGYLLSGGDEYLADYRRSVGALPELLTELHGLTHDNRDQSAGVAVAEETLAAWRATAEKRLGAIGSGRPWRLVKMGGEPRDAMSRVRESFDLFIQGQAMLRAERAGQTRFVTQWVLAGGAVLTILLGLVLALRTRRLLFRVADDYRAAIEARDEFLSVASHELKTPLTSLMLVLQMMGRTMPVEAGKLTETSVEAVRRSLARALSQAARLSRLVDELLDVARLRAGRVGVELNPTDLSHLMRLQLDRFQEQLRSQNIEIFFDAPGAVFARCDSARIEQVVGNLIGNAIKYGRGSPIEVRVFKQGGVACLSVRDSGLGIAPEDQKRIFDRFERAQSPMQIGGLGLGLYISREIVRAHGGTIKVESAPGQGSTFTVTIPLASAGSAAAAS